MTDDQKQQFLDKLNQGELMTKFSSLVALRKEIIRSITTHTLETKLGKDTKEKIEALVKQKDAANEVILELLLQYPAAQADALLSELMTDNSL